VGRFKAEAALVLAALLFGTTFVIVQDAIEDITPMSYIALRFTVGTLALAPFAVWIVRRNHTEVSPLLRAGAITGVILFVGYALQTIGLQYTESSTSAFITGLYVVFTPIIESIVRRRPPPIAVWLGCAIAAIGLFLLTGAELTMGRGEAMTLGCAVAFAAVIVYQGGYANRFHPVPFTTVQLVVVTALALPPTAVTGIGDLTAIAIFAVVFTGVACSAGALTLQFYGQRRVPPSRAALILLSEPVFAGIAGYIDGDRLGAVRVTGAVVILAGIALAELSSTAAAPTSGSPPTSAPEAARIRR